MNIYSNIQILPYMNIKKDYSTFKVGDVDIEKRWGGNWCVYCTCNWKNTFSIGLAEQYRVILFV